MNNFEFNDVALVSVIFNSEKVLSDFSENAKLFKHVFLIDNASVDESVSQIRKMMPHAEVVENEKNIGFGAANQIGLKLAKKAGIKYCLFLNPDCIIDTKSVAVLIDMLKSDAKVAVASPAVVESGSLIQEIAVWDYLKPYEEFAPVRVNFEEILEKGSMQNVCISGACFMVDVDIFFGLGGFDEKIFLFFEEDDISLRVRRAGYVILFNAKAKAFHIGAGSTPKSLRVDVIKNYSYMWSKLYLKGQHISVINRLAYALKLVIIAPLAVTLYMLLFRKRMAVKWMAWGAAGLDSLFMTKFFQKIISK